MPAKLDGCLFGGLPPRCGPYTANSNFRLGSNSMLVPICHTWPTLPRAIAAPRYYRKSARESRSRRGAHHLHLDGGNLQRAEQTRSVQVTNRLAAATNGKEQQGSVQQDGFARFPHLGWEVLSCPTVATAIVHTYYGSVSKRYGQGALVGFKSSRYHSNVAPTVPGL